VVADPAPRRAEVQRLQTEVEIKRLQEREQHAQALRQTSGLPAHVGLETLNELARNANARIYIGFDKHDLSPESE
jgi:hypothetical protein